LAGRGGGIEYRGKQTEGERVRLQQAMRCDAMRCRDTTRVPTTGDKERMERQKTKTAGCKKLEDKDAMSTTSHLPLRGTGTSL
jgi:hypothetical protein